MVFALVGWSPVLSRVPQWTVLVLFLIYINDLPDCVTSRVRLFADDCLTYCEIHNLEDQLALQKDLDILEQWANKWVCSLIQANVTFCQYLDPPLCTDSTRYVVLCSRTFMKPSQIPRNKPE